MKVKELITGLALFTTFTITAQDSTGVLEGNNVRANLSTRGIFFNNGDDSFAGYEVPKEGGNHLIYSSVFWFGAKDIMGSRRVAAELFNELTEEGEEMRDLYPGAISADGLAEAPAEPYAADVYIISREEIEYHRENYATWGYTAPYAITNWPAHGDLTLNLAEGLAPFSDLNGNGTYEPELGEYPKIRGDHAAYLILNDKGGPHLNTGGEPLGIEVHFMFYQYERENYLNNTTFVNVRVINRSTNNYPEFIVGNFTDADIGEPNDDYGGCNSPNNMIYAFNSVLVDEGGGGQPGYGENPPALGIVSLNHNQEICCLMNGGMGPYDVPSSDLDYWNLLSGETLCYEEVGPPSDKRLFTASEPISLGAGEVACFDYAFIYSRMATPEENIMDLKEVIAPEVQSFYESTPKLYCDFVLSVPEESTAECDVYPNPTEGRLTVDFQGEYDVKIYGLDGRLMYFSNNNSGLTDLMVELSDGTYVLVVENETMKMTEKLVVKR